MATLRVILCGICEAQHIKKYADQWCPECDEGLCSDCENHHKMSKASRNHGAIPIANYHKLPSSRDILCGICEAQHITKYADKWCPECDEGLFSDCENHHKVSKVSRYHGVISLEQYRHEQSSNS